MKNKVFLVMLLSIAALSAGCNTVAGAGKDIQRGGEKIEALPPSRPSLPAPQSGPQAARHALASLSRLFC